MKKTFFILAFFLSFSMMFQSCDLFSDEELNESLGWLQEDEDTTSIEDAVYLGQTFGSGELPSSVDLSAYFPPIGDQGQYGTCVAWAVGYNHKSFLEAKASGYQNYTNTDKIFSAKDLYWSIDKNSTGEDCNGANFASAYDVIQNRGIATESVVPYENLGDCSASPESSWTNNASNHKISSYREIELKKNVIKDYLANGRAVVFGAKLGDEFMNYTSGVLDYQTYGYTGQHAYHAMILSGYDDNMGANGAFRVVNSWGSSWGDNGGAWVDQDFFCSDDFGFCAFVATDVIVNPDEDGNNEVDDPTSGYDVMAWELDDQDDYDETDQRWRKAFYNVYNSGDTKLNASDDWSIVYLLYNAYDGNDYQVILFDYYSDDYGSFGENGLLDDASFTSQIPAQGYWWNNVDVETGQSVADAVFGNDDPFSWGYYMPDVTGEYYLVIYADAFDDFAEADESNNFSYFTAADGEPLNIVNGVIQNAPAKNYVVKTGVPVKGQDADNQSAITKNTPNTYSTNEIRKKLLYDKQTGKLQHKVFEYVKNSSKNKMKYSR